MTKVVFSHACDEEYPTLLNYVYEASHIEKVELLANSDWDCDGIDLSSDLLSIDFEITVHSENEFTLEITVHDGSKSVEAYTQFCHRISEWIEMIPDYNNLKFRVPEEVGV